MIVRSYNPIERGRPAVWLQGPIREPGQVARFMRDLRDYPADAWPLDVVIDSPGGATNRGLELYVALRETPRRKRVTVLHAASMGSLIAMAGDHVRIVEGGSMFLHSTGYASDHLLNEHPVRHMPAAALRGLARTCEVTDAFHCSIFARRTGLPSATIGEMRARETTLSPTEAVRLGFADEVIQCP